MFTVTRNPACTLIYDNYSSSTFTGSPYGMKMSLLEIIQNNCTPDLKRSKTKVLQLMRIVRFISPKDPRWLSTMERIEQELVSDSLVYRYRPNIAAPDGFLSHEGTFSTCSFWYVECLSRSGQLEKARFYFEKMLGYANHLGLYAEQLGFEGGHLGNFPQAFTHLGLISAAYNLDKQLNDSRNKNVNNQ